jgi:hypothetical protein
MSNGQKRGLTARHMNDRITRPRPSEVVWTPERARVTAILRRGVTSRKPGGRLLGRLVQLSHSGKGGCMHAYDRCEVLIAASSDIGCIVPIARCSVDAPVGENSEM